MISIVRQDPSAGAETAPLIAAARREHASGRLSCVDLAQFGLLGGLSRNAEVAAQGIGHECPVVRILCHTLLLRFGAVHCVGIILVLQEIQIAFAHVLRTENLPLPDRMQIAVERRRGNPLGRGVAFDNGFNGEDVRQ